MKSIWEILEKEPIRLIDGRYSDGFVDLELLNKLIELKAHVKVYQHQGMKFVRLIKNIS